MRPTSNSGLVKFVAVAGLAAPLLVLFAAMATDIGWIGFDFGVGVVTLQWAWWAAWIGTGLGLAAVALNLGNLGRAWPWLLVAVLAPGLTLAAMLVTKARAADLPPVHEVATDWSEPLAFTNDHVARRGPAAHPIEPDPIIPERVAGLNRAWAPYAGRRVAEENAETCPGARTIPRLVSTEEVVAALEAEGVVVIGQAPWRVEGEQESPWFGRARDVVVRMQPEATDIRSIDRIGLIDLGQNCDLVTALVERLSR